MHTPDRDRVRRLSFGAALCVALFTPAAWASLDIPVGMHSVVFQEGRGRPDRPAVRPCGRGRLAGPGAPALVAGSVLPEPGAALGPRIAVYVALDADSSTGWWGCLGNHIGGRYGVEDGSAFDTHAGTSPDRITPRSIRAWTSCSL